MAKPRVPLPISNLGIDGPLPTFPAVPSYPLENLVNIYGLYLMHDIEQIIENIQSGNGWAASGIKVPISFLILSTGGDTYDATLTKFVLEECIALLHLLNHMEVSSRLSQLRVALYCACLLYRHGWRHHLKAKRNIRIICKKIEQFVLSLSHNIAWSTCHPKRLILRLKHGWRDGPTSSSSAATSFANWLMQRV